ncbi:MAG: glycerol kinase GlpK [Erysipelotrichales bacterium]|nr:MAG: glycerol kinase GlpK [Erysipelotrichales bacterium]
MAKYVLAMDQGTTSSRSIIFDKNGAPVESLNQEFEQIYPKAGWVEHRPLDIWNTQLGTTKAILKAANVLPSDIVAVGVTNQRETTTIWDKHTGEPVYNSIVWQCRRTASICDDLRARGWADKVRAKTGVPIDAYFSGTKIKWILDNVPGVRARAEKGDLLFGTIDTWIIWKLSGGKIHATDYSNASRTMIFNIHTLEWDAELLKELNIPRSLLPEVKPSSAIYGMTDEKVFGAVVPIAGCIGDQQSAMFGQTCFEVGSAKAPYCTGAFLMMQTGEKAVESKNGLLTTIAWGINGKVYYALEGNTFVAGATVQWLRDELKMITSASETEELCNSVPDTNGAYLVPAFVGLAAPYWDSYARACIVGLTRGVNRAHIVRAAIEGQCFQIKEILDAMVLDGNIQLKELKVDGGAVKNNFLLQFQSDLLNVPVSRPVVTELTALGTAYLAGLAVGYWKNQDELLDKWQLDRKFTPQMDEAHRAMIYKGWKKAVQRSLKWIDPE